MALTTAAKIRGSWLSISDTTQDARLGVLIAQAESIIDGICRQPIAAASVTYDFTSTGERVYVLPYTVPVVMSSLQYKTDPSDANWTTVTGAIVTKVDGVWQIYLEGGLTRTYLWRMNATVGYDGVTHTIPKDVENVCEEMTVELFKMTDFSGRDNRLGLRSVASTEGGVMTTTIYRDLNDRFRAKLSRYIARVW
jgi:hypothetical protein